MAHVVAKHRPLDLKWETYEGETFAPYALAIGQAALAWSNLHVYLGFVFQSLCAPRQGEWQELLSNVWHSSTQDRACREMLRAAATERWPLMQETFPTALADIEWVLGQVNTLEEARNNIIHSPMSLFGEGVVAPWTDHQRAAKLRNRPDLLVEIHWCRDTALVFRDYASAMDIGLENASPSWPDRPILPNRGQKNSPQDH